MRLSDHQLTKTLKKNHYRCPACRSFELSASDYDGNGILTCKVTCEDCDATWYEHYTFASASDFEAGDSS